MLVISAAMVTRETHGHTVMTIKHQAHVSDLRHHAYTLYTHRGGFHDLLHTRAGVPDSPVGQTKVKSRG